MRGRGKSRESKGLEEGKVAGVEGVEESKGLEAEGATYTSRCSKCWWAAWHTVPGCEKIGLGTNQVRPGDKT